MKERRIKNYTPADVLKIFMLFVVRWFEGKSEGKKEHEKANRVEKKH